MKNLLKTSLVIGMMILFANGIFAQQQEDFDYIAHYEKEIEDCQNKLEQGAATLSPRMVKSLEERILNFQNMLTTYHAVMNGEQEPTFDMKADFMNLPDGKKIEIIEKQYLAGEISEDNYQAMKSKYGKN